MKLIVLRPQPGADATAARAADAGLEVVVSPLFVGRALTWRPPDPGGFDALLVTSANAVRYAGPALASYWHLPVHAVGEATARAAREAGFEDVAAGDGDVDELLACVSKRPHRRLLHLCGAHRRRTGTAGVKVRYVPVYAMEPVPKLVPDAEQACRTRAAALVHSPRAARALADLVDAAGTARSNISVVAISEAAASAAGGGWCEVVASTVPTDAGMLAIARALCDNGPS